MELIVKFFQLIQSFFKSICWTYKISNSEVISTLLLTKAITWNCHDSSLINHIHTIHRIDFYILTLSFIYCFFTKMDPRKSIHSSLQRLTFYKLHFIESLFKEQSSFFQTFFNLILFELILVDTLITLSSFYWWINHQLDS